MNPAAQTQRTEHLVDVTITIHGNEIRVKSPWAAKPLCDMAKARLGAGHWDQELRVWVYPDGPHAREIITDVFGPEAEYPDKFVTQPPRSAGQPLDDRPFPLIKMPPWQHQRIGGRLIEAREAVYLEHDMGTGKTKTTIDAIVNLDNIHRILILCPKAVVDVWPAEIEKHAAVPLSVVAMTGSVSKRTAALQAIAKLPPKPGTRTLFVTNYAALVNSKFVQACCSIDWDLVVCDEAHHIKAPGGVHSRAMARIGRHAQRRLCLSGDAFPHSIMDAYAQCRFLDPTLFGQSFTRFRSRYAVLGGFESRQVIGFQNREEFAAKWRSISHTIKKRDVLDLPPFTDQTRHVELSRYSRGVYSDLSRNFWAEVEAGEITAANALVKLLRLQQVTSGFVTPDFGQPERIGSEKLAELEEVFGDLPVSEPIVVVARFTEDITAIRRLANKCNRNSYELSGTCNDLETWKQRPNGAGFGDVLAVQIQSGSEGIDLTRACYVVYFSVGFDRGLYEQNRARVDRPGQTRSVTYIHLVARDSVDEQVYAAFAAGRDAIKAILEAGLTETQR